MNLRVNTYINAFYPMPHRPYHLALKLLIFYISKSVFIYAHPWYSIYIFNTVAY